MWISKVSGRLVLLEQRSTALIVNSVLNHVLTEFLDRLATVSYLRGCLFHHGRRQVEDNPGIRSLSINPLTPNDPYRGRTAPLTPKRCILYIYSTNIGTEYFKHSIYCPFFLFKMQFVS